MRVTALLFLLLSPWQQVPPAELEGIIVGHPEVADCGVVGVRDPEAGEVPRAYVVRTGDSKVSEQQIKDYVHREFDTSSK